GKTVYLSQGHGFYWSAVLGRWATQRGNTHGIVEDLVGAEGINHYLIPLLLNAGATVFPMREFDMNVVREVVDQSQALLTGEWSDGPGGYDPSKTVLQSGQNPFEGGHTLITNAGPEVTATARFEFDLEGSRKYALYASWSAAPDRVPDVHFRVHHGNTVSEIRVDQRRHGKTWMYLGHFPASLTHVEVTNQSDHVGTVSIDAIRAGGGLGLIERGSGAPPAAAPTSMRPRWEECSRYTAQYQGAPTSVYDSSSGGDHKDDVGNRARYAAWQHEEGEDAVFVSWHSNAPEGGTGTSTYVYGPNSPNGSYNFTGTQGSDALAQNVHNSIVNAIKDEWDPNWKDRGIRSVWFGELNPKSNPEMPAVLVEKAFHATEYDANYLAEPRFRFTLARA
ncbi:MAG TPA: N-acetylmuramoyl-L-alanine amidase, partial [Myxococcales bacterium]|nr:N-acetylmuramoyl-L-alanine amidase [Myxococcales bacterium]